MNASAMHQEPTRQVWSPPLPKAEGFEHALIGTPGLRTHVATIGTGEPIVLLHGFPAHWWEWRDVAPALAARGYRVICLDLRGSGWTRADKPGFERTLMQRDVLAVLDELGVEQCHLVGHDLGGVVSGQLAYAHPERVRSLVQLSVPPSFMRFSPKIIPAFKHMPPLMLHRGGKSLRWLFSPAYCAKPMTDATIDGYLRVDSTPGYHAAVRKLYREMIIPEAMKLSGSHYKRQRLVPPTLVVFGRQDGPFQEATVRSISRDAARRANRFELAFVAGASHFIVDDEPAAVTALIEDWVARAN